MIDYIEDIKILPVKKIKAKQVSLASSIKAVPFEKLVEKKEDKNKPGEILPQYKRCVMPPQPQAYIKCPRYDFF